MERTNLYLRSMRVVKYFVSECGAKCRMGEEGGAQIGSSSLSSLDFAAAIVAEGQISDWTLAAASRCGCSSQPPGFRQP